MASTVGDDIWKCCKCDQVIPKDKVVYRLTCIGSCEKMFHIKCLGMSKEDYFQLKKDGGMWYCGKCDEPCNTAS